VETIVLPIVADLQHEYSSLAHSAVTRSLVLLCGYWSFWKAVGLHTILSTSRKGGLMIGSPTKRWTLPVFAVIILVGTATYGFLRPMVYRSETRILIEPVAVFDLNPSTAEIKDRVENRFQGIMQMAESRTGLEQLVKEFRLRWRGDLDLDDASQSILENLEISRVSENVLSLAYRAHDSALAQVVARRMAEVLIETRLNAMRAQAMDNDRFLESQLIQAEMELADSFRMVSLVKDQGSPERQVLLLKQARLQRHADDIDRMRFNSRMAADALTLGRDSVFRILDDASLPEYPMFPARAHIFWMGIAAALLVALPAALGRKKSRQDFGQLA